MFFKNLEELFIKTHIVPDIPSIEVFTSFVENPSSTPKKPKFQSDNENKREESKNEKPKV